MSIVPRGTLGNTTRACGRACALSRVPRPHVSRVRNENFVFTTHFVQITIRNKYLTFREILTTSILCSSGTACSLNKSHSSHTSILSHRSVVRERSCIPFTSRRPCAANLQSPANFLISNPSRWAITIEVGNGPFRPVTLVLRRALRLSGLVGVRSPRFARLRGGLDRR